MGTARTERVGHPVEQHTGLSAPSPLSLSLAGGRHAGLLAELCTIDSALLEVLEGAIGEIYRHDRSLFSAWQQAKVLDRIEIYALHYLTPFHALWAGARENKRAILGAMLMSGIAWRAFDNAVDGHVPPVAAHGHSLTACTALVNYVTARIGVSGTDCAADVGRHYRLMGVQAERERREAIPVDEIWSRCSIFMYAPESLAQLDDERLQLLRDYINYVGLAHDLSDVMSDIGSGIVSLPLQWLAEASENGGLNARTVESMYARAREAIRPIEARFANADVATHHPLLWRLLVNSRDVFDGHRAAP